MADAQTLDLFDGLPLDYNFLDHGDAAPDSGGNASNGAPSSGFVAPDDQMLLDSDVPGSSPTNMMGPQANGEKDDLLTPLNFSFNTNAAAGGGPVYRVAPQHKHKRVRSNPDVLQGFGVANMAPSVITPPVMSANGMGYPQQHSLMPIRPVQVERPTNPVGFALPVASQGQQESFQEMDEFLKELSWSEITPDQQQQQMANAAMNGANGASGGSSPVEYHSQRVQEGLNELKMKRKRPVSHHTRNHSNPVELLYNLDQVRVLAQQTKQQQQQQQQQNMNPNQGYPNPFASFQQDPTVFPAPPQPNMQQFQFQVPPQIASGAAHSLHARRSSLGSNLPPRAAARRRGANRSSGLSMDMSQMNLGFLSVPEEPSAVDLNTHRSPPRRSASTHAAPSSKKDDASRKLYKCGRCGQPKVGHICTMPDQRNNWTQVDLEVTKGLKVMRVNCHIMPVKSKWVSQCDDHEPPQLPQKAEVKSEEEVEAEPLGL